jgi:hypothetical protein
LRLIVKFHWDDYRHVCHVHDYDNHHVHDPDHHHVHDSKK